MRKIPVGLVTVTLLILFFAACYYDNEEALYPTLSSSCDTLNVSYTGSIATILSNNCYSCHSDANAAFGGGVHLQKLSDVVSYSSRIIAAVKQTGPKPMPPSGKLNPCSVSQFDIWLRNGMN